MEKVKNFYDLKVWQKAHNVSLDIYKISKKFPKDEKFGLVSQIRRASFSVTSNIAEGFGRYHYKDKIKFYHQARGSSMEVQSQLLLGRDLNYINKKTVEELFFKLQGVNKGLNGLISSINKNLKNS